MSKVIDMFIGENRFLSNFFPAEIIYEGIVYPTSEHAFAAAKSISLAGKILISRQPTPGLAKSMGRSVTLVPDWQYIKRDVMKKILQIKFAKGSPLAARLLSTGDAVLIEGNNHGDSYWGAVRDHLGNWDGSNFLGKILMEIREELKSAV